MEAIVLFIMLHLAQNSNKARSIGYLNSPVLLRVRLNDKPPILNISIIFYLVLFINHRFCIQLDRTLVGMQVVQEYGM